MYFCLLQVLLIHFICSLSIRLFCYVVFVLIFCYKIVLFPCHLIVGTCWRIHLQLADRTFLSFWNVLFFLYCFILSWYVFSLPFPPVYILLFYCLFYLCFSFSFQHLPAFFLCLIVSLDVVDFLSAFPVEFPIQVLSFCLCSLDQRRFFRRVISLQLRLVHLILWCCSLR